MTTTENGPRDNGPRDLAWHLAHAADQLDRRLRNGDQIDVPRPIDHFAVFPRRALARRAARDLVAAGYVIRIDRLRLRSVLTASHRSPVDAASSTAFIILVVGAVEAAGGDYDGWRARIVPAH
ncbi:ribonuclease E inhibitor RraB [Microbacteriaceae bacterium VKM Ac-2855]|nr:ribonuclease E inhibitor RraB [Microbacteriaceae bacterium VKM Ac-2855]